jgi:predicted nucleotidyltransferase
MTVLDKPGITTAFSEHPRVQLAVLFGSSRNGLVRPNGDVDIGVLLSPPPSPLEFYRFYQETASRLGDIAELDLVDLSSSGSVLAFEALCGERLFVRDPEAVATFASLVARQYEDDMLHAAAAQSRTPVPLRTAGR